VGTPRFEKRQAALKPDEFPPLASKEAGKHNQNVSGD